MLWQIENLGKNISIFEDNEVIELPNNFIVCILKINFYIFVFMGGKNRGELFKSGK